MLLPSNPRRHWWTAFFVTLAFVFAADYFFLHILSPLKKAALLQEINREVENHLLKNPPSTELTLPAADTATPTAPPSSSESFVQALAECFGTGRTEASPQDLLNHWQPQLQASQVELENWEVKRPQGTVDRILLADSERSRGIKELRLFQLDSEGIPTLQLLEEEKSLNPKPGFVKSLLQPGEVISHQKRETRNYRNGMTATVETINNHIHDLQVTTDEKAFSCRELDCQCRRLQVHQ